MCETRNNCIGRLFYWGQILIYFYHILWNHKVDKINKHCDAQFLDPRWQVPETISWVWGHTNYLNFIQSLAIKVKWAPLHHHSDPFELIDRALIIIIILLWLCIKHHRTTCTSGGPQRRVAGDNGGGEEPPTLSILGSSADIYTSLSWRTLAAETKYFQRNPMIPS